MNVEVFVRHVLAIDCAEVKLGERLSKTKRTEGRDKESLFNFSNLP